MINRLVLGTVQIGMPYGISNTTGKPDFSAARDIIKTALELGITRFDTAQAYGDSEEVLGKIFDSLHARAQVKVYSKLHPALDLRDRTAVERSVDESLHKLKIERLEGLLLHHEDALRLWPEGPGDILQGLVARGKVKSAGASFYTPEKALRAVDIAGVDLLQVPANILDRRFEDAGVFTRAGECKKEVFVRSILLQGLVLMDSGHLAPSMSYAAPYLQRIGQLASQMRLSRLELALGYAAGRWPGSFIIFGAENKKQVSDNVRILLGKTIAGINDDIFRDIPENVLNPSLWPKL